MRHLVPVAVPASAQTKAALLARPSQEIVASNPEWQFHAWQIATVGVERGVAGAGLILKR